MKRDEQMTRLAVAERRRELHNAGADDDAVDAVVDFDTAGYEWDDAVCPVCGSIEACGCEDSDSVQAVEQQVAEQIEHDRRVRAENIARYPDATARRQVCQPCKKGEHVDHHRGVWRRFDGSSPVVCSCERCGDVGAQTSLL